ncbi:MAG: hypothetical protein A2622_05765 [Bdellovibrionales bacterium RIFCSPHIGHO2_01_FULL_40_29]|nr:MAG: hypothetical protein A2622_05765 [Bdellovibrionales bacterium RIFCSPHIGHO2_01_FULL_40_29]OFZ34961.1 MAG: hypothetical protein A3D17_06115 [Bdellovibrionales bacterium RIFCSPHIGHO2_02_FULL_40_15]
MTLKDYTILVVDDDDDLRELMLTIFESNGFTVLSAGSGSAAFELVKTQRIDLLVSDMRMPGGDGMSLLENVRAFNPKIPVVIFVTGFSDVSVAECLAKGATSVFAKPFNQKELINAVKTALDIPIS